MTPQGIHQSLDDSGVVVTGVSCGICGKAIQIFGVVDGGQPGAFGFADDDLEAAVMVSAVSMLEIENLVVGDLGIT